jgi:hypothetical protein
VARKSFHDQAIESHLLVGLIGRGGAVTFGCFFFTSVQEQSL